jgi:hypothetical protein
MNEEIGEQRKSKIKSTIGNYGTIPQRKRDKQVRNGAKPHLKTKLLSLRSL